MCGVQNCKIYKDLLEHSGNGISKEEHIVVLQSELDTTFLPLIQNTHFNLHFCAEDISIVQVNFDKKRKIISQNANDLIAISKHHNFYYNFTITYEAAVYSAVNCETFSTSISSDFSKENSYMQFLNINVEDKLPPSLVMFDFVTLLPGPADVSARIQNE